MFVGPVFSRELITAPRRPKHFIARATYASGLLMLMGTAWLVLTGTQVVRSIGDLARFGNILFQILAPLQLAMAVFFAALFTASSVSQEKDRRTLILLLVTDLSNFELVLGKLFASLLNVLVLIVAALPLFVGLLLMGGVELSQIAKVFGITICSAILAGSLGSTIALWREKTFQALALTVLALFFWIALWEVVALLPAEGLFGFESRTWAVIFSPWQAILEGARPGKSLFAATDTGFSAEVLFLPSSVALALLLNAVAVWRVRHWNPSREARRRRQAPEDSESIFSAQAAKQTTRDAASESRSHALPRSAKAIAPRARHVWNHPVLWREVCTWAYGRKIVVIRVAYLLLAAAALLGLLSGGLGAASNPAMVTIPVFLISLFMVNTQAVTSLSTERDAKTIDLLLVTDLSPKDFIFGKLGGVLFNTKEMIVVPLLFCVFLWLRGNTSFENMLYLIGGLIVMDLFVAVLGIHCGLIHDNTRVAIATSLGSVFFLFVGIAACMRIMVAFSGSFGYQLAPFLAFMIGGGAGLYVLLGARNASTAIFCAAFTCPFLTFWAITSYLQQHTLGPFLVTTATYVFTTLAMLIPAISEFDLASGRATE